MKKVRMLALVCAAAMLSGCTTYYEVTDPTTDKTYYTTELERNRDGSVELKDTNSGKMVSKRELLAQVWRLPYGGADKTVDVHLSWLRRKLGETAAAPRYIHTRRGVGVKLVAPDA